jgi:prepilin-type N-terminal cleavage/methylation domain-containing protein
MRARKAFTLVEILIVVVILGILAAIVIPRFTQASGEAAAAATLTDLVKMRKAIGVYRARNNGNLPPIAEVDGDPAASWGPLVGQNGEYMQTAPVNSWIGGDNSMRVTIVENFEPDASFQTDYGWVFDPIAGELYAGSFDSTDRPIQRNN